MTTIETALRVVPPISISSDAQLVSSTVAETDYAAWSATTAYAVGDRVIRTTTHSVYQRLVSGTTASAPEADAVNWTRVGPTNRWKAFDLVNSTSCTQASTISFRVTPGALVNAVALLGLSGSTARIRMVDPVDGTVYDKTTSITGGLRNADWYTYFFGSVIPSRQVVAMDLPTYATADILVDITPTGGLAAIGTFVAGAQQTIGTGVNYGARLGIIDYSVKTTNQWGDVVLTQRAYSRRGEFEMWLTRIETDDVIFRLANLRATPALYVASSLYESTTIFGFYKDFSVNLALPESNACSIQIEGLT